MVKANPAGCQLPSFADVPYPGKTALQGGDVVTILLERSFSGMHAGKIGRLIREMRVLALQQPGYVASQTLLGETDAEFFLVTNTWETWMSMEHWHAWYDHPERQELEAEVNSLLESPARLQVVT